jgi:cytochrome P450
MEWAFKESIRLEPPVPFVIRRSTRPVELGDLQLPEDATIGVSAWVTHNLSRLWNRPERFDPERFSPERAEDRRHPHGYFPIGCTHACLGSYFILLQAKAFVHQLLRSYRFTAAAESSRALGFLGGRARSPKVLLEPI